MSAKRILGIGMVIVLTAIAGGQEAGESGDRALWAWQTALEKFHQVGALIGLSRFDDAKTLLAECEKTLPEPYSRYATDFQSRLKNALYHGETLERGLNVGWLAHLCVDLHAYQEAVNWGNAFLKKEPQDYYVRQAVEKASAVLDKRMEFGSHWFLDALQTRYERDPNFFGSGGDTMRGFAALFEAQFFLNHLETPEDKLLLNQFLINRLADTTDWRGCRAWEEKLLREFPANTDACAGVFAKRAERARGNRRDFDEALQNYRVVCEKYPTSQLYGAAQYNLGAILQAQKKYDNAIAEFRKLLASNVNDHDPSPNIMRLTQNYHHEAQWAIAECFFAMGKYDNALQAYRDAGSKYPFWNGCGNCAASASIQSALHEGLCLEYLGKRIQAVNTYFPAAWDNGLAMDSTVPTRLVDLYESAGQIAALAKILDEQDSSYLEKVKKDPNLRGSKVDLKQYLPTKTLRRILEIRAWGKTKDWQKLISLIHIRGTVAGPNEAYARQGNFEAVEAAKQLAKSPQETVPLLIQRLNAPETGHWIDYALGLCGTPEAVSVLKGRARKETNCWSCYSLIYSLSLAGKLGSDTIESLSKMPECNGNLAGAIDRYRAGTLDTMGGEKEKPFPPIPAKLTLPAQIH